MFLRLVKRFKPFALLVLLFFLSLLYTLNSFAKVKNKVVKDFLHPKLIDNEAAHFDINKQLSIVRTAFKKKLAQYEVSKKTDFGKSL